MPKSRLQIRGPMVSRTKKRGTPKYCCRPIVSVGRKGDAEVLPVHERADGEPKEERGMTTRRWKCT
jgi:hypothetical protein